MAHIANVTLAISLVIVSAASAQTGDTGSSKLYVASGVVKTVSASSLTLERDDTQITFAVNASTRLVGNGLPRDLVYRQPERARKITDLVRAGDRVRVTYRRLGGVMNAVEVRLAPR